ncbi:MAG: GNAT family N-acetyltransferase [Oscillospiraceae bacterium]|nr:GNAT family N-acetyltransferase [Oscillospiraceae bacterium]
MTNKELLQTALNQSAVDFGCNPQDFISGKNKVVISQPNPAARRYLPLPFRCDMVSYGDNIVAQTSDELFSVAQQYINTYDVRHCFETPHLQKLDEMLAPYNHKVCFMAEYFLPDMNYLKPQPCAYEIRILEREDFSHLYLPQWSNALSSARPHLDMVAAVALDGDKIIGMAGASADCETMWQIGIDVLPEYRRQGIASALTSRLALEVISRGKVPFYCAAWCNIKSVRNAIRSGFRPRWVEITARDNEFVEKMNKI